MSACYFIGLDIHKKMIAYCIKTIDGRLVNQRVNWGQSKIVFSPPGHPGSERAITEFNPEQGDTSVMNGAFRLADVLLHAFSSGETNLSHSASLNQWGMVSVFISRSSPPVISATQTFSWEELSKI